MIQLSNAKINLGLAITDKRNDGYHNIHSIFLPIELKDIIEILPSEHFEFKKYGLNIPGNIEENLCIKAYNLLKNDFHLPPVKIILYKNIPIGAGLGGGSSNGTHTLIALNKFFSLGLTLEKLASYARMLGSDCEYFLYNKPCIVEGKGDIIKPLALKVNQNIYILIVKPNIHSSTTEAYKKISPHKPSIYFDKIVTTKPISEWKNYLYNDFEPPLFKEFPILNAIKEQMYQQNAIFASMTGSGSAIYGFFDKEPSFETDSFFIWKKAFTI